MSSTSYKFFNVANTPQKRPELKDMEFEKPPQEMLITLNFTLTSHLAKGVW